MLKNLVVEALPSLHAGLPGPAARQPLGGALRRLAAAARCLPPCMHASRKPKRCWLKNSHRSNIASLLVKHNLKMSLRATSTATDGQFVIATLYDEVCISHENLAEAQIVSVESPSILSKVLVPHHIKQLLMCAASCNHQLRFNMTFDFPQDSRLPIITAASAVPFNTYSHLQPIPTNVSCGFCLEDPFDYKTGKWLPNVHRLAARDCASELKIELYYKCIRLLQARSVLPIDDNIFRFKTQTFHHSDGDLLQNVAHQRWLTRATLPTLYYRWWWQ